MDEVGFVELDQAAVAGAEGTAWEFDADLGGPSVLEPMFAVTFPIMHESTNAAVKEEPCYADSPSSPHQGSFCTLPDDAQYQNSSSLAPHRGSDPEGSDMLSVVSTDDQRTVSPPKSRTSSPVRNLRVTKVESDLDLGPNAFADLRGTTAARSRKMSEDERRVMLHKRRLRNRASAARSREKRSRTITDLTADVESLMRKADRLSALCSTNNEELRRLRAHNILLRKENDILKGGAVPL